MLTISPAMLPRLDELEASLLQRRARAEAERLLGEIEGIDLTLQFLREKRDRAKRIATQQGPVSLGLPSPSPLPADRAVLQLS
jgi:hypothetical protein